MPITAQEPIITNHPIPNLIENQMRKFLESDRQFLLALHSKAVEITQNLALKLDLSNVLIPQLPNKLPIIKINQEHPTCVIFDHGGFCGDELMAYAASTQKLAINFIYASYQPGQILIQKTNLGTQLAILSGIIITEEGKVQIGRFPKPVTIDLMMSHLNDTIINSLASKTGCPQLTPTEVQKICNDKALTESVCLNLPFPDSIVVSSKNLEEALDTIPRNTRLVIKPTQGAQGQGVKIIELADIYGQTEDLILAVENHENVLVQPKIESLARYDIVGQRLDWNLRVLVLDGELIDLEVRTARDGQAVNKATGAIIEEFVPETFLGTILETAPAIEAIHQELKKLFSAITKSLPEGFLGLDVIIDQQLKLHLIEINAGLLGGISSLAEIRTDLESKLSAPLMIAHKITSKISKSAGRTIASKQVTEPISIDQLLLKKVPAILNQLNRQEDDQREPALEQLLVKLDAYLSKNPQQAELVNRILLDYHFWDNPNIDINVLEFTFKHGERSEELASYYHRIICEKETNRQTLELAILRYSESAHSAKGFLTCFASHYFTRPQTQLSLCDLLTLGSCLPKYPAPIVNELTAFFYFAMGDNDTALRLSNFFDPKNNNFSLVGLRTALFYRSGDYKKAVRYVKDVIKSPDCTLTREQISNLQNQILIVALANGDKKLFKSLIVEIESSPIPENYSPNLVAYLLSTPRSRLAIKSLIKKFWLPIAAEIRLIKTKNLFDNNYSDLTIPENILAPKKTELQEARLAKALEKAKPNYRILRIKEQIRYLFDVMIH